MMFSFVHYEDASMGSRDEDEEEQRPLTTADIRALLDEQDAKHKEEIKLHDARHKEEVRALLNEQDERINAHQEEIRALEEETDRRLNNLERASSSPPQDANDSFTDNRRSSNSQPVPNPQRRGNTARFSLMMFRTGRNEGINHDNDEGDDDDDSTRSEGLEEDTFSLMMLHEPFREIPCCHPSLVKIIPVTGFLGFIILFADVFLNPTDAFAFQNPELLWSLFATFWIMILGPLSSPWQLSMFTFAVLQMLLGMMIIGDQTLMQSAALGCFHNGETCVPFHVPIGTWQGMTSAQYLTVFFALVTQNDLSSSLQTLNKLWNTDNVPWDKVIGQNGNRTWRLWACRILLPNILKFIQAVITLFATFIVIVQTSGIVDLLKDFTALFVLSEADNIMFHVADLGYFGDNLMKKTEEVKAVRWMIMEEGREEGGDADQVEEGKRHRRCCNCSMHSSVFFTLWMVMVGALTYVVVGQYNGRYLKMKYPECNVLHPNFIGDQICGDDPLHNTAECGWDGGDCPEPTDLKGYINCTVSFPNKIGNGVCDDWPPYNTEECGFDGKDCIYGKVAVDGYPDCLVGHPEYIRDRLCHDFAPYNTPECGYDGGRCDPPQ